MPQKIKEDLCFIIKDDDEVILFIKKTNETSQNMLAMWTNSYSMTYTTKIVIRVHLVKFQIFKSKNTK